MTVLVSGFGPWGSFDENPSLLVLQRLESTRGIVTLPVPVDTVRLDSIVADAWERHRPTLWLGLGLAYGASAVVVERVAVNLRDFAEPDIAGARPAGPVVADGPAAYLATVPAMAIRDRLRGAGIPARVSDTAGTFLCNQLMYAVLHAAAGSRARAGFLHLPAHPALVARQEGRLADAPSMAVDLMADAVRLALEVAGGAAPLA